MNATYSVWSGTGWIELPVPMSGDEGVVVPNVNGVVYRSTNKDHVLLQRRDKPGEPVRGRLEVPGGRWKAGERPDDAVAREVYEETGVTVLAVAGAITRHRHGDHVATSAASPLTVVVGCEGSYPSLHVVFECIGRGEPRPVVDEVADPRWWPVADVLHLLDTAPGDFLAVAETILRIALEPLRGAGTPD